MDILRTVSSFILGIGLFTMGVAEIKKNATRPLMAYLCCLTMSVGLIGYILLSKWLFLVIGIMGLILLLILG